MTLYRIAAGIKRLLIGIAGALYGLESRSAERYGLHADEEQIIDDLSDSLDLDENQTLSWKLWTSMRRPYGCDIDVGAKEIARIRLEERQRSAALHCCFCPDSPDDGSECNCHQKAHFLNPTEIECRAAQGLIPGNSICKDCGECPGVGAKS